MKLFAYFFSKVLVVVVNTGPLHVQRVDLTLDSVQIRRVKMFVIDLRYD